MPSKLFEVAKLLSHVAYQFHDHVIFEKLFNLILQLVRLQFRVRGTSPPIHENYQSRDLRKTPHLHFLKKDGCKNWLGFDFGLRKPFC